MSSVLSDLITNRDATPVVRDNSSQLGGFMRETIAQVDSDADTAVTVNFIMMAIPSNARLTSLAIRHAEAATTGQGNIGIARLVDGVYTFTGGDADRFASAYDFDDTGTATNAWVEVLFESTTVTEALALLPLWGMLGLSADPGEDLYIAIDVSEIFSGGPTSISMRAQYAY
jgi:hypothetical protein